MLRTAIALALLASLLGGQVAAAGKKPPSQQPAPQSEADDGDDDRAPRGPAAAAPAARAYAPPAYAAPPAPGRYVVLTEKQKRCGVQNRCELDSRTPCPPCW